MSDPQVAADYQQVQQLCEEIEQLRAQNEAYLEEWMQLGEELE